MIIWLHNGTWNWRLNSIKKSRYLPDLRLESSPGLCAVTGLSHDTVGVNISVLAWNWLLIFTLQYSCLAYPWLSHPRTLSQACKFRPLPETFTLWRLDNLDIKHKTAISQIVRSWEWEGDTLHDATQTQSQEGIEQMVDNVDMCRKARRSRVTCLSFAHCDR